MKDSAARLVLFISAFLSHWLITLLVQFEANYLYGSSQSVLTSSTTLILSQEQNIALAVLVAFAGLFAAGNRSTRWVFIAWVTLCNLYVASNILSVKIFNQYFRPSFADGQLEGGSALWDSIAFEIDGTVLLNLGVVALMAIILGITSSRRKKISRGLTVKISASTLAIVAVAIFAGRIPMSDIMPNNANFASHPLVVFIQDTRSQTNASPQLTVSAQEPDLDYWQTQSQFTAPNLPEAARRAHETIQRSEQQPNLILIVLESVGSLQLFPEGGEANPAITPNISRLQKHALVFDSLYSVFPGTVRSHVALNTGGNTITWGSVSHELSYEYKGPTINRTMSSFGFATGLFSSQKLEFENMNGFYRGLQFDTFHQFGQLPGAEQERFQLNSWGGEEFKTLDRVFQFVDQTTAQGKPFYAAYLNVATHHPYSTPKDYPGPSKSEDRVGRYQNALHYTDAAVGDLIRRLEDRGLMDNTLVAITGDHGQAFGDRHVGNLTHKNFLYEENVKNFLLLYSPRYFDSGSVSHRIGSIGDIFPTLADLYKAEQRTGGGRSLFAETLPNIPVYFHKNAYPELWGLRYDNWKFIASREGGDAELYDLSKDPLEQNNLAAHHGANIESFKTLIQNWYVRTNDRFTAQLENYRYIGGRGLAGDDLLGYGPKIIAVGHSDYSVRETDFVEQTLVNPLENLVVWTKWVGYPYEKIINYRFIGPNGVARTFDFTLEAEWSTTRVKYGGEEMAEGPWRVELWDAERKLIEANYEVRADSPLFLPQSPPLQTLHGEVGSYTSEYTTRKEDYVSASYLTRDLLPVAWNRWPSFEKDIELVFNWKSPSGRVLKDTFTARQGWDQTWVDFPGRLPLEPGNWQVSVVELDSHREIAQMGFSVLPQH